MAEISLWSIKICLEHSSFCYTFERWFISTLLHWYGRVVWPQDKNNKFHRIQLNLSFPAPNYRKSIEGFYFDVFFVFCFVFISVCFFKHRRKLKGFASYILGIVEWMWIDAIKSAGHIKYFTAESVHSISILSVSKVMDSTESIVSYRFTFTWNLYARKIADDGWPVYAVCLYYENKHKRKSRINEGKRNVIKIISPKKVKVIVEYLTFIFYCTREPANALDSRPFNGRIVQGYVHFIAKKRGHQSISKKCYFFPRIWIKTTFYTNAACSFSSKKKKLTMEIKISFFMEIGELILIDEILSSKNCVSFLLKCVMLTIYLSFLAEELFFYYFCLHFSNHHFSQCINSLAIISFAAFFCHLPLKSSSALFDNLSNLNFFSSLFTNCPLHET